MSNKKYSSGIKGFGFLYPETRRTAILISQGKTKEEIIELAEKENIYQLDKEKRRRELAFKMITRLETLSERQVEIIATGDEMLAKYLMFIAILKTDVMFAEFMEEVFYENCIIGKQELEQIDFSTFFNKKSQESEVVAKWASSNLEKIQSAYIKVLASVDLAKKTKSNVIIQPGVCSKYDSEEISQGNERYINTFILQ